LVTSPVLLDWLQYFEQRHFAPEVSLGVRPRRLALAADGTIYYSDYARGYLGHFDPAKKKVEEWASPGGPTSKPYGIAVAPNGMVWYSENSQHAGAIRS
jgi:virginiamycin B lyase